MKRKFIVVGLGVLSALSLPFAVAQLGDSQSVDDDVNYAQVEIFNDESREDFFNWEYLMEQINNLPLFRYTVGITLIFFLIFVFAIVREKELNPITMRQETGNPIVYFNNLLSSVAKKEPWEVFEKIFLPIFIGLIASLITYDLEQIQEKISDKRLHEQIWENYLKEIREILATRPDINNNDIDNFDYLDLIRANTLAVSIRLEDNKILKGLLVQFLYDTKLIKCQGGNCERTVSLAKLTLENAQLVGANLRRANLSGANFNYANMNNSEFMGTDLSYATLVGARLKNANLNQANLSFVNLKNADLRGADLSEANLTNANLSGAKLDNKTTLLFANLCKTILPDGKVSNKKCP
ncbi:MAG: pentapeptide repeat-containing protein [Microcoleaceae cyanobacterium MO_207.B10]|nr:pentapeptide repeat-containing protein [Microcoleaceae cyanobacterium MO_207.B10]